MFRRMLMLIVFLFVFLLGAEEKTAVPVSQTMQRAVPEVSVSLPDSIDKKLADSSLNWLAKEINEVMITAIRDKKVRMEQIDDFLFLQVIPNFAYLSEDGEERLGKDLMDILDSGKFKVGSNVEIMQLHWQDMVAMHLPFKKNLLQQTIFPASVVSLHLDLTFFVNVNRLTGRVFEILKEHPRFTPVYNSQKKFYRTGINNSKLIYLIHIPNLAYEVAYTATPLPNIMKRKLAELNFLADLMRQYESRFAAKGISWDGRYLKNSSGGMIDMWFLYQKMFHNPKKAGAAIESILAGKHVSIKG